MIYAISFNHDLTGFAKCEKLEEYATPQNYFSKNVDYKHLLVEIKPKGGLYMVVRHKFKAGVATHPWTKYSWIKHHDPKLKWADMKKADWIDAVSEFMRTCGIDF